MSWMRHGTWEAGGCTDTVEVDAALAVGGGVDGRQDVIWQVAQLWSKSYRRVRELQKSEVTA